MHPLLDHHLLLLHGPGDGGGAAEARLSLLGDPRQQLLDLGNGAARIETLGAGLGAVHDGVTSATQIDILCRDI